MTDNAEFGDARLLALPHHKQAHRFENQELISIINELGISITRCWYWVLSADLLQIKNSLLPVRGCLHVAPCTWLQEQGGLARGHPPPGPLCFKPGSSVHRPFLRALLLTHLIKPAMLEVPQMSLLPCHCNSPSLQRTRACIEADNAKSRPCKGAAPANLDRQEANQLSALLTATFHIVGFFSPHSSYNFSAKLFLSSGLHPIRLLCAEAQCPELHRDGTWSSQCPSSSAGPIGRAAVTIYKTRTAVLAAALLCRWCAWPLWPPNPFCSAASPLQMCFLFVSMLQFTLFHLNCVWICLVTLFLSFPSPEASSDGLLIS